MSEECRIETKEDLYCRALPIIKGLEEAGEDMQDTKAQVVLLGMFVEDGTMTPHEACQSLRLTFGSKAVEESEGICLREREEILADAMLMEEQIADCEPCFDRALSQIVGEREPEGR